jgi:methylase of polypeptide subunit release factors
MMTDPIVAPDLQPVGIQWRTGITNFNRDTVLFAEFIAHDTPESFLDVGTGTGYLAIRLALAGCKVQAIDISSEAVELAKENAKRNGIALQGRVSDLFENVEGTYDAIAFNPPFSTRPDPYLIAVVKHMIRSVGPLERAFMHHMPRRVAVFRRTLIGRFLEGSIPHLSTDGALYLLVYSQEVPYVERLSPGLTISFDSYPTLKRRNLRCVKLARGGKAVV